MREEGERNWYCGAWACWWGILIGLACVVCVLGLYLGSRTWDLGLYLGSRTCDLGLYLGSRTGDLGLYAVPRI